MKNEDVINIDELKAVNIMKIDGLYHVLLFDMIKGGFKSIARGTHYKPIGRIILMINGEMSYPVYIAPDWDYAEAFRGFKSKDFVKQTPDGVLFKSYPRVNVELTADGIVQSVDPKQKPELLEITAEGIRRYQKNNINPKKIKL